MQLQLDLVPHYPELGDWGEDAGSRSRTQRVTCKLALNITMRPFVDGYPLKNISTWGCRLAWDLGYAALRHMVNSSVQECWCVLLAVGSHRFVVEFSASHGDCQPFGILTLQTSHQIVKQHAP